jgi:hypothetical protein
MLPAGISTETPSTTSVTVSRMQWLLCQPRRQVRREGDGSFAIHDLRDEKLSGRE